VEHVGVASPGPSHAFLDRYAGKAVSLLDNCFTRFVFDSVLDDAAQFVGLSFAPLQRWRELGVILVVTVNHR
jgi:hypothetical protein